MPIVDSIHRASRSSLLTLVRDLLRSVVRVLVGSGASQETFMVHKELVSFYSTFFEATFDSDWVEADSGVIQLPDDSSAVLEIFQEWLYTQHLTLKAYQKYDYYLLAKLVIFADKIGASSFYNKTIDALRCCLIDGEEYPDGAFVSDVYDQTSVKSSLRRLLVEFYAYDEMGDQFLKDPNSWPPIFLAQVFHVDFHRMKKASMTRSFQKA